MGIWKWKNRADFPFSLTTTNNIKIFGIIFPSHPDQVHTTTWANLVSQIIDMHRYKYKTTNIFGKSTIVNTYIIPKLVYIASFRPTEADANNNIQEYQEIHLLAHNLQHTAQSTHTGQTTWRNRSARHTHQDPSPQN
jgi:hypothetical protein